jgi:hypothetical protein
VRTRPALSLAALLLGLAGCSPFLGVAERDFGQGRYLQASEVLGAHESDVGGLSPRQQAEYGLMRGLSLWMLGDAVGAARWLHHARRIESDSPGTLEPAQRAALYRGLEDLARRANDARWAASTGAGAPPGARGGAALR